MRNALGDTALSQNAKGGQTRDGARNFAAEIGCIERQLQQTGDESDFAGNRATHASEMCIEHLEVCQRPDLRRQRATQSIVIVHVTEKIGIETVNSSDSCAAQFQQRGQQADGFWNGTSQSNVWQYAICICIWNMDPMLKSEARTWARLDCNAHAHNIGVGAFEARRVLTLVKNVVKSWAKSCVGAT